MTVISCKTERYRNGNRPKTGISEQLQRV